MPEVNDPTWKRANTDWFSKARWGVMTHYLGSPEETADAWNKRVDSIDVQALADQVASTGAAYYLFTIGQNSGHYCSPNAAYDSFVGISPSKCSRRDLIGDLADALTRRGVKLLAYLNSAAPYCDKLACRRLQWEWGYEGPMEAYSGIFRGLRLAEFQRMWEAIIREWSTRWGNKVHGWWIDGCYFGVDMYNFAEEPNWRSFASALKSGNKESLIAFNGGVNLPVVSMTQYEDYTAGEIDADLPLLFRQPKRPMERFVNGAQLHILTYLGETWGAGSPRFPVELPAGYTKFFNRSGGVVTWDVPISAAGVIPQAYIDQLKVIGKAATAG
ncbi:MAG: hypothetical protein WC869_09390 [Phycisphaerae bacterium]|jgi:hypothetical protein